MDNLEAPDSHHFSAAVGWLELGVPTEALAELKKLASSNRRRPDVLEVLWGAFAALKDWSEALATAETLVEVAPDNPIGWINQSYSLHELKRTQEAWDRLVPAATKFPKVTTIPYNLACYACQLGQLETARQCLAVAIQLKSKEEIRTMALQDADLKPLWEYLRTF